MKYNLPVLLLNGTLLFPNSEIKLEFFDELSKSIIEESELFHDAKILVVTKTSLDQNISVSDLPKIGTVAKIDKKIELPNGRFRVTLKGIKRNKVIEYINPNKYILEALVKNIEKEKIPSEIEEGFIRKLLSELDGYIEKVPYISNSLLSLVSDTKDIDTITDIIVSNIPLEPKRIFCYLMEEKASKRVEMLLEDIYREEQLYNIEQNIDTKVRKGLDKDQKDFYLKEKIKLIKNELGESSFKEDEIAQLKEKVELLKANDDIKLKLIKEIDKYENLSSVSPEVGYVRSYINYMLELPFSTYTKDLSDLKQVRLNLDKNHYGVSNVKERIIEYLAVKELSLDVDTPIICLVGPPGVGKTTLASSIASSINRNFVKISLGGVCDEALIKGHVRTYLGATPGLIIDGIKRSKSSNPVFLIDEIDKMCVSFKGDPASALLEVLDPSQNKHFKDNYIEEEYDLSKVLFIVTANDITKIPEALRDRLEIISIPGYTELEKIQIAQNYLIPTICRSHGIDNIKLKDDKLLDIIRSYTHESGVRELYRIISKLVRKAIKDQVLENKKISLTKTTIDKYLGKKIYSYDIIKSEVGIVYSMAHTENGGDIIPIETNCYDGNSNLILTGSIGDVMLESAKIALSYIKANYKLFNINPKMFNNDIHINVPNIAIKKDGPSGGLSITTALISLLSNLKIDNSIAMTGEITLRGNILKVGGIKEKIIGAYINNIKTIFIPYSNKDDLDDLSTEIKSRINIILVKTYDEVFKYIKEKKNV